MWGDTNSTNAQCADNTAVTDRVFRERESFCMGYTAKVIFRGIKKGEDTAAEEKEQSDRQTMLTTWRRNR